MMAAVSSSSPVSGAPPTSAGGSAAGAAVAGGQPGSAGGNVDREKIYQWIIELSSPDTREAALLELSKKREVVSDLAPMLWHSFGN